MKKITAIVLAAILVCAMRAGCGAKDSGMTIEKGKLIMSTNAAFPPYEMVADDGSFEGIDVEIAGAIAKKLDLELVIDDMDFDAALLAVQEGMSDIVMAGVTVNESRLMVMNFSDSYATGKQMVIVKEGSDVTMANLGERGSAARVGPPVTSTLPTALKTAATVKTMSPLTTTALPLAALC